MKVIIYVFLSLGFAYCETYLDRQELFDKVHIECQSDPATYADEELLVKACHGEKVDVASIGPHILCMNVKLNIQKKNGEINKDTIKSDLQNIYNGRKVMYILQECTTIPLGEAQDTAVNIYKCLHKYDVLGHHDHTRRLANTKKDFVKAYVTPVAQKEANKIKAFLKNSQGIFDNAHNECQSDPATYADEELLVKVCHGEKVDVASVGPHILCMNVKLNIQKENGEINKDTIKSDLQNMYNDIKVKYILQECTTIPLGEAQDTAVNIYRCLHKYEVLGHHDHTRGLARMENDFVGQKEAKIIKAFLKNSQEIFDKAHNDCQSDPATYADEELLVKVCHGEKVDVASVGPHILCMNVKLNIQKENGEINKDTIKSDLQNMYNDIKVKYILQECTTIPLGEAQDTAVNIYRCLHKYEVLGHHDHTRGLARMEKDFVGQKEAKIIKAFLKNSQEIFDKAHNDCQSDPATYADEELLVKVCHGEKVDVASVGPHILCMNVKLNIQKENGEINKDTIKSDLQNMYNDIKVKYILQECTTIPLGEAQDTAVNIYRCLHKYEVLGHHDHTRGLARMEKDFVGQKEAKIIKAFLKSSQEIFDKAHNECQSDPATYADEELLVKVCHGEKVDVASVGPHILCMNVKLNIQKENGEINKDTIKSDLQNMYNDIKVKYILQECTAIPLGEAQDTAVNIYKCLHKYEVLGHHDHTRGLERMEKDFVGQKEAKIIMAYKKNFDRQELFDKIHNECQSDPATSADEDLLVKVCHGKKVEVALIGPHILCMNAKLNIQEKNGDINKDTIKRDLENIYSNEKTVKDILHECTSIDLKATQFDVSVNLYKCLHKYDVLGHHDRKRAEDFEN